MFEHIARKKSYCSNRVNEPYRVLAALGQTVLVAPEGEGLRDVGPGPAELDGQLLYRSRYVFVRWYRYIWYLELDAHLQRKTCLEKIKLTFKGENYRMLLKKISN